MLHDFESELNKATDSATFASLGSGILGSFLLLTPFSAVGLIGLGASFGSFATAVLLKSKSKEGIKKVIQGIENNHSVEIKTYKDTLLLKENQIVQLQGELTQKSDELNKCLRDLSLAVKALQAAKDKEGDYLQGLGMVADLKNSLKQCIAEALEIFESGYECFFTPKRLKDYPELLRRKEESEGLLVGIRGEFEQTDDCLELLRIYFWLNEGYRTQGIKNAKSLIIASSKDKEVELNDWESAYQELVRERDELAAKHLTEITNLKAQLKEYMNGWIQELENERDSSDVQVRKQLDLITMLSQQVEALKQPFSYKSPTRPDMRIANTVIEYFWSKERICLDRAGSDYKGHEATLEFNAERTGRLILASELNDHSEALQALIHTLNKPEFKLDPETGLLTLLVRWATKPATDTSDQAKRLLMPLEQVAKKLVDNLSHKPSIRVMGATGEGKGVMVRYLLKSILANNAWYCRLHDPQHGSSEDHWGIPKVSKSGNELKLALKDIEKQMIQREANGWSVVTLDTLDEIDTHLEKKEKKESFIDLISRIRHLGMKLILIGQNPKVGRAGFEWSDMQQMNCIYMGASAFDAIEANPQLKPRKDKLTKDYLTLSEHYERVNEGLSDGEKYLFGLVVIPGKMPMWVELPRPDSIEITCEEFLLGKTFTIPNSLSNLIDSQNPAENTGNPAKTNRNSNPSASAETLVNQEMPPIIGTKDYVGVADTVGIPGNSGKATCKKHPDAELRLNKDGRYYCPSCKKRIPKSDVEYRGI